MFLSQVQYYRYFLWHGLLTVSLSYSIHNFIIHETSHGTLLEFIRLSNASIYDDNKTSIPTVTVILLTHNSSQNFTGLKSLLPAKVKYIDEQWDAYKLKTTQVHVLIQPTHSTVLPGFIKFMAPIKKMNASDIAKFVMLSMEIEKNIISPNIDKVLCFPKQQVILMNTVLGNYHSFTMYVVDRNEPKKTGKLIKRGKKKSMAGYNNMTKMVAKELLNPIHCDLMYHGAINIDV